MNLPRNVKCHMSHVNFFLLPLVFFCWRTFSTQLVNMEMHLSFVPASTVSFFFQKKKKKKHLSFSSSFAVIFNGFLSPFLLVLKQPLSSRTTNIHNLFDWINIVYRKTSFPIILRALQKSSICHTKWAKGTNTTWTLCLVCRCRMIFHISSHHHSWFWIDRL